MTDAKTIAKILLDLEAVSVSPQEPFTWTSGLRSPIYCDNRLIISTVAERRAVAQCFVDAIKRRGWQPDVIAGTATAGIPHAAWVAEAMSLPMVYVRSAEKKHGKRNLIEGRVPAGAKVVVVEDLISTGGSCIQAADALVEAGAGVLGITAVFQYGLKKATDRFAESGYAYTSLTHLAALLDVAIETGRLPADQKQSLFEWQADPQAWSAKHGGA
ncbi:orotate phosphoribosyltransferase [Acanthopleuribacter pedis]|uniref:Orotate phosphoribosyltransferase n=1 Tax=Acanthopleuribacter pedis TaxID=442870 RepID=A0A8J7QQ22_9BACT|nr:orotate phosphoribosyltransferase [Acanthopleuribacter pedis]MBO1322060.1 orotate phosphoribosyltransferase [Acanthopleuribacter pedis]